MVRSKYTEQERAEALKIAKAEGVKAAARALGCSPGTISKWAKRARLLRTRAEAPPVEPKPAPAPAPPAFKGDDSLTDRQRRFVHFYLGEANCNGAKAARLAGYSAENSERIAYELKSNPKVRAEIDKLMEASALSSNEILHRLSQHARADLADFIDMTGGAPRFDLQSAHERGLTGVVRELTIKTTDTQQEIRLKLHDSQSALDKLAKAAGLYSDGVTVNPGLNLEDLLAALDEADLRDGGEDAGE